MAESPLLFPVYYKDMTIFVLDETSLPFHQHYEEVKTLQDALLVLKDMKTRAFGQVLLFFYSCLLLKEDYTIVELASKFKETRPTFDFELLGAILTEEQKRHQGLEEAINDFVAYFDRLRRSRAMKLAAILPDPALIMTICNFNGELIYLYDELQKLNKKAEFIVCETRPYLQGTRLTFWELKRNNIPCKLICDNQSAQMMRQGKVNCIITGADRATTKGDIVNKIGTYSLARLAHYYKIPFYPLTQYPKDIDPEDIKIEERPGKEVFMFLPSMAAKGQDYSSIEAVYPSFDITINNFVTRCIELRV